MVLPFSSGIGGFSTPPPQTVPRPTAEGQSVGEGWIS